MKTRRLLVILAGLFAALPLSATQPQILISDNLAANANTWPVDKGAQWLGKMAKWHFGDYKVVSSKMGPSTTNTHGNLFNTEMQSRTTQRFSFALTGNATDSAAVEAASNMKAQWTQSLELGNGWSLGKDELVQESYNFTALITVNHDTTASWALFMGVTGSADSLGNPGDLLTKGARKIRVVLASSNSNAHDLSGLPALGYQFLEDGQSLGAVQYFSGAFGNPYRVWMLRTLDAPTGLVLAAAMTALLQMRSNELSQAAPGPP